MLALSAVAAGAATHPDELRVEMELRALGSGELLFEGVRINRVRGGHEWVRTRYTTPEGALVAESEVVLERATLAPVSYRKRDLRRGKEFRMWKEGDTVRFATRDLAEDAAPEETGRVAWQEGALFSTTLAYAILRRWDALQSGETVRFPMLVPSRQDAYAFRMFKDAGAGRLAGGRTVIRVEPTTWLVRQFVDPLEFVFESGPPYRLLEYRGRISLVDREGGAPRCRVTYHYPRLAG